MTENIAMNRIIALVSAIFMLFFSAGCVGSGVKSAAIVYCVDDGETLYSENADTVIAPASLTKLLTACVALKYVNSAEVFTVGTEQKLVPENSSVSFILNGHRLKLYDLITAMLLVSGNDAAYTVAVSTARIVSENTSMTDEEAVSYFCGLMNSLALEIGMSGSNFTTPDGSDDNLQYTTAADLLKLAEYALGISEIKEIICLSEKYVVFESGEVITWKNTNKLLDKNNIFYRENAIGMKTGTTGKAGNCLISAFYENEKIYITVVTGCQTDFDRYNVTLGLLNEYKS